MLGVGGHGLGFLDLIGEDAHALVDGFLIADGNFADGPDALFDELRVHFVEVLPELVEHRLVVLVVDDPDQDFAD